MKHLLACILISTVVSAASAATTGTVKICKEGQAADWEPEREFWRREVVIPSGATFLDYGLISNASVERIKLRVVVTQPARLIGDKKCTIVRAKIPDDDEDKFGRWGNVFKGDVVTAIKPTDERILYGETWGTSNEPAGKMAPWADVPNVQMTIETEFQ